MEKNNKDRRINYIFIDYENVQPTLFELSDEHEFKLMLFVGVNQSKIPIELATSMQAMGNNAEYIRIEGNGKNALDFHVAFYLGYLYEKNPKGYFHIISKDTGFDVLIKYLRARNILVQRYKQIEDIPLLKISTSKTTEEKIECIINFLVKRGNAKPKKVETLANSIDSLFKKSLSPKELEKLINYLTTNNFIEVEGTRIHYTLSKGKL